jgi:hypothetical protein
MANAAPLDLALDELAQRIATPVDTASAALQIMALWHVIFDGAMQSNDVKLAVLAAREWRNAKKAIALLEAAPP